MVAEYLAATHSNVDDARTRRTEATSGSAFQGGVVVVVVVVAACVVVVVVVL